jgi:folylpolyglutamate synthase/dihydropteroate synthase
VTPVFTSQSAGRNSVFKLQKKAIRLITNTNNRTSCRELFKKLGILPLQSQCILSLAVYGSKNMELFTLNADIHTKNTRNKFNLFLPQTRLTKYQKGVYFAGIKIFNHLPENIKTFSNNTNKFKNELKKFLLLGSFYTIEEFYEWASKRKLYATYL